MSIASEVVITLPGGRRVDAQVGPHVIHTDQDGTAPSPFDVFLASLGACAGYFVQRFCATRGIAFEDIRIVERPYFDAKGTLDLVELDVELPPQFPVRYRDTLLKVIEECSVRRAIAAQPEVRAHVKARAA